MIVRAGVAFPRNLQILTREGGKWRCTQQQLERHPCKGLGAHACRDGFVGALV